MKTQSLTKRQRYTLQQACRGQMINKLLADIAADMVVCDLEGWDKMEYIRRIDAVMRHFIKVHHQKSQTICNDTMQLTCDLFSRPAGGNCASGI